MADILRCPQRSIIQLALIEASSQLERRKNFLIHLTAWPFRAIQKKATGQSKEDGLPMHMASVSYSDNSLQDVSSLMLAISGVKLIASLGRLLSEEQLMQPCAAAEAEIDGPAMDHTMRGNDSRRHSSSASLPAFMKAPIYLAEHWQNCMMKYLQSELETS